MAQAKKNGDIPINARINIKYNGKKPKISFSYPSKKHQVRGSMLFWWKLGWLIVGFLIAISIHLPTNWNEKASIYNLTILSSIPFSCYGIFSYLTYPLVRKKFEKIYPAWEAMLADKKLAIFKPIDVKETDGRIFCELPIFNNVVCDFKANGEFSDYLNEIDIREHKFVAYNLRRRKAPWVKKNNRRCRKVNEFLWYARFYFSQKPTKGKLQVIFK